MLRKVETENPLKLGPAVRRSHLILSVSRWRFIMERHSIMSLSPKIWSVINWGNFLPREPLRSTAPLRTRRKPWPWALKPNQHHGSQSNYEIHQNFAAKTSACDRYDPI